MYRTLFLFLSSLSILYGCADPETSQPATTTPVPLPTVQPSEYRYEVFQNIDSVGNPFGYGYDIFNRDKKLIHQTNIPGEPGIDGFVNAEEAGIVAELVIQKLGAGGGFPTLTHEELVNSGITLKQ